ncbi:unnamed protein product [Rotaria sp. Silwood2]|nr:unnamed protein product [Rotaria sp. Silwood2]
MARSIKEVSIYLPLLQKHFAATGFESGMRFQSVEVNGKLSLRRYSPAPPALNICACSIAFECPDPSWSGGQFLCQYGDNCTASTAVWSVPGLVKSCTSFQSVLSSDLRCFFNQTCFNILLSMFNVDMLKRLPLPTATLNIKALNSSALSLFLPEDRIETLWNQLMVEEWKLNSSFDNYYKNCAPSACTYTRVQRMDRVYIVATIGGLFGGLVTILRLIVPIAAKLLHSIMFYQHRRRSNIHNQELDRHEKTAQIIAEFIQLVPNNYRGLQYFVLDLFHFSFLPTAFNNDWLLEYGDESDGYLIRSVPRSFTNTTCNCMISGACKEPLRIGPPDLFLPGLVVGCLPFDGLRMSTLECFFSSSCISTILTYLEYYTQMDGLPGLETGHFFMVRAGPMRPKTNSSPPGPAQTWPDAKENVI